MKKKRFLRFFSLILCLCFALFSFAGCGEQTGGINDGASDVDDGEEQIEDQEPTLLGGVKTLTRPENYDYDAALDGFSENFYNIFSGYIMQYLYQNYSLNAFENDSAETYKAFFHTNIQEDERSKFPDSDYKSLVVEAGTITYPLSDAVSKYYFYETPRYQITKITNEYNSSEELIKQTLVLDTSKAWTWGMNTDVTGKDATKSIFENYVGTDPVITERIDGDKITIEYDDEDNGYWANGWIDVYDNATNPNYSNLYYGILENKIIPDTTPAVEVPDYFTSPFSEYGTTGLNYYQDALEYAIYMIVLGYDHVNDAPYFDFTISDALKNGEETGASMTVGGWGASKISVEQALANAKERFKLAGNYIGFANKNIDTLTDFILKKVIGQESKFDVELWKNTSSNPIKTGTLYFNHNYEAIVHNIIRYACDKAPIGKDKEGDIHLADTYLTSKITDYNGDYFGIALDFDENGEYDDSNLFSNIEAAEYQSIVFMPQSADVGKKMTDVWLIFEYFDLPDGSAKVMDTENGITINVGIRYYDSVTQAIYELGETQITIKYAKNGNQATEDDPEGDPLTMLCFGEGDAGVDISFTHTPLIQTSFTSPDEIDAQKNGQVDGMGNVRKSIQMTGANKDYYKLNDSSSYGQYGTLNEAAFVGENACDFVEVYFDIVKDKNAAANKSYSFKVGATIFFEDV